MADVINSAFPNLFDIGVREQVSLALCNSASDTFFLLSGPPSFVDTGITVTGGSSGTMDTTATYTSLCPLLFTMSFTDSENKQPDQQIGSFGTANTVTAPSPFTPTYKAIQVGAAAYVTSNPCAGASGRSGDSGTYLAPTIDGYTNQWNLLKRLYYWLLADSATVGAPNSSGDLFKLFFGSEEQNPNAVAPDPSCIWGNFAKSDLYKVPFGLMVAVCDKSKRGQTVRYYEGCVLQQAGANNLDAGIGRVTTYQGTGGFTCTYSKCRTFTRGEIDTMMGASGKSGSGNLGNLGFLEKLLTRYGGSGNASAVSLK